MSFTQYKWGVSKPYRNIWSITGVSSLRTDYARIVQINNFLLKLVLFIVKRVRSLDKHMNFSHTIIKNYSLSFYDRPFFSVEMFFWIKTLENSFASKFKKNKFKVKKFKKTKLKKRKTVKFKKRNIKKFKFKKNKFKVKKFKKTKLKKRKTVKFKKRNIKKFKFKKNKFKKNSIKLFNLKNKKIILLNKPYSLHKFLKLPSLIIRLRYNIFQRYRRYFKLKKLKKLKKVKFKYLKSLAALNFTRDINRFINEKKRKKIKLKPKKQKRLKRFKYYRLNSIKNIRLLKLLVLKNKLVKKLSKKGFLFNKKRFNIKIRLNSLTKLFRNIALTIQKSRILSFLNILNLSFKPLNINILFLARLINLGSGSVYLYLNHFTKKASLKKETSPKTLVKTFIRQLKKDKKLLRIKGALIKAKGRFTRKDRAPKFKMKFGRVSTGTFKARVEYASKEFIFRFGVASIKLFVNYAR